MNLAIINLPARTDRLAHMERQLSRLKIERAQWFSGVPGGKYGCAQAHIAVLKWVVDIGEPTLILEDDVILQPGFMDWEPDRVPLYLGGEFIVKEPLPAPGRFMMRPEFIHRSHAYAVTPDAAKLILATPLAEDGHYDHSLGIASPYVEVVYPFPVQLARMGSDVSR